MKAVLQQIGEIQRAVPERLRAAVHLDPINETNIEEHLARTSQMFPPVFAPVFERGGDVLAVHARVGTDWRECAWVELPHDEEAPILVATRFRVLPAAVLASPVWVPSRVDEIWDAAVEFAASVPGAALPERSFVRGYPDRSALRSAIDPQDGAARMADAFERCGDEEEAAAAAEQLLTELPDDPYVRATVAAARRELGRTDGAALARSVLEREVTWGFRYAVEWFMRGTDTGAEVLETVRPIALAEAPADDVFAPLKEVSLKTNAGADALRGVAERLNELGRPREALDQLRNAAAIVGPFGRGVTAEWCARLAAQTQLVEPNGVAAQLAELAASVHHQGP